MTSKEENEIEKRIKELGLTHPPLRLAYLQGRLDQIAADKVIINGDKKNDKTH